MFMDLKNKKSFQSKKVLCVCTDNFLSSPVCCLNYQHKSHLLTNFGNYITCLQTRDHVVTKAARVGKYYDGLKHVFFVCVVDSSC